MKLFAALLVFVCLFTAAAAQNENSEPLPVPGYDQPDQGFVLFRDLSPIRGQTIDDPPAMFMVQVVLEFPVGDPATDEEALEQELIDKSEQIQNTILIFLGSKSKEDLAAGNSKVLEEELLPKINALLTKGRLSRLIFNEIVVF